MKTIKRLTRIFFKCLRPAEGKETFNVPEIDIIKTGYNQIELEMFSEVNRYRESIGLRSLLSNLKLSNVAYYHTDFMIKKGRVTHENFPTRLAQTKKLCNNDWMGEVLTKNYTTAKGVLGKIPYRNKYGKMVYLGWLGSKTHRAIIESDKPIFFGCSVSYDNKAKMYVTLLLID